MGSASYVTLSRQSGLLAEMQVVANNIANAATTGYRQEGVIFAEYVQPAGAGPSLSIAHAKARSISLQQGALTETGGRLDLAIEGAGFFLVETPSGQRLTRAGSFALSAGGDLVTSAGYRVLDDGGAPIFVPPDASDLSVAADGTISAGGNPLGRIGLVRPADSAALVREAGTLMRTESPLEPVPEARVLQGFLEGANVEPILQVARMIEVQRAYELGQSFLDAENERLREAVQALTRR
ncbi:MAG: flagellar hook-basal body complex protein [Roseovarius sp.]